MRRLPAITMAFALLLAPVAGIAAGRNPIAPKPEPQEIQASPRAKINDVYVIHFVLDGLGREVMERLISEERLPTIQDIFVRNGAVFTHALSNFPSTSSTIYQSYVTGLFPGHSGIPHLERLDRTNGQVTGYLTTSGYKKVNTDFINLRALTNHDVVELEPPTTIFELLKGYPTASISAPFWRGATLSSGTGDAIGALWSTYASENVDNVDFQALKKARKLYSGDLDDIPRYTLVGLYSSDIQGHKQGPHHPDVEGVVVQFDMFLKEFLHLLAQRGIADKTYAIVSADHGMHETGKLFKFKEALEAKGIFVKPANPRIKEWTLYAANRGVVSSHIYIRHDGGFEPLNDPEILRRHPTKGGDPIDLIDFILNLEATDLLIVRAGERKARILSRDGKVADIACHTIGIEDFCSYRFDRLQGDPLGYSVNPALTKLLDGLPHSTLAWRDGTAGERYPDAVIQLSQIFHDGRAGDAFITTRGRWGFRKVKKGNHGGAENEDMRVPLMIAGPTVPKGKFSAARPADIYPLLLSWFGFDVPDANHDGADPFKPYRGEDVIKQKLAALEELLDGTSASSADFVCGEAHRIVKPAHFTKLLSIAREESSRRAKLVHRLEELLKSLRAQRDDKEASRIVDSHYLSDHIAIVKRTLDWARGGVRRMDDIVAILTGSVKREASFVKRKTHGCASRDTLHEIRF